ncbi:MAG TPA: HNH endonuclease signature motif containing protein, partial [Bdellovibrionales bacterium]|nr:HNH endonuclease signature motif containing protein [Bdellovibrionales bacterium]
FCKHKLPSLFEYATKVLGYSEHEANNRISAMRLMKEIPQIEEKIESGALTLSNLVNARTMFNKEKQASIHRTIEQKVEVLEKLERCSKLKAEKVLQAESFLWPMLDLKAKGIDRTFFSDDEVLEPKLKRLFELKAQSNPNMSLGDLINEMADECISRWDPVEKAKRNHAKKNQKHSLKIQPEIQTEADAETGTQTETQTDAQSSAIAASPPLPPPGKVKQPTRYYPAVIRHALYMRDQGRCQNCGSGRATEIDHIVPFAMGGTSELENLRLLCRPCNQRHAIKSYGSNKMQSFLRAPVAAYH